MYKMKQNVIHAPFVIPPSTRGNPKGAGMTVIQVNYDNIVEIC